MEIIWHGQACFTLKGSSATVVTDPYGDIGLKLPKLKAEIVTISHEHLDHNNPEAVDGVKQIFSWPGEYEAKEVMMTGVHAKHFDILDESKGQGENGDVVMFHIELDGIKIAHLGDLGHKLTDEMVEALGDVDVLLVPVGGDTTIDHKVAHEVVEQVDPRIVIPMHYKISGLTTEVGAVDPFLKEVSSHTEAQEKLVIKSRTDLPEDTTEFIVLEPQLG